MIVAVTGHRPDRLPGGFDENAPERVELRARIEHVLGAIARELSVPTYWHPEGGSPRGRTGMALGVDQDFALACVNLGIPYDVVLPFEEFDARWDAEHRARAAWLCSHPLATVTVAYPGAYKQWKLLARNEQVIEPARAVVAVFDGAGDGGTAQTVQLAISRQKRVWCLNPNHPGDVGGWLT